MSWTKEKNILRYDLFGNKIIQKWLKIDATHLYDNDVCLGVMVYQPL